MGIGENTLTVLDALQKELFYVTCTNTVAVGLTILSSFKALLVTFAEATVYFIALIVAKDLT